MAIMVKSVEFIEFTHDAGSTSSGIALTKGQDYTNCVPFFTAHGCSDTLSGHFYDIYFNGTTELGVINFLRAGTDTSCNRNIKCYVVEFDPAEVKVQQGSFVSLPAATTTAYNTSESFDQSKTAMVHYWYSTSATNAWDVHLVRGRVLSNGTQVDMYRNQSGGTVTGHYYLFEDISANNDHFSVWHATDNLNAGTTAIDKRPPEGYRDPTKSFILGSWACSDGSSTYNDRQTVRFFSYFKCFWRCDRNNGTGTIYSQIQIIKFNNENKVYIAHQREYSMVTPTTTTTWSWDRVCNTNLSVPIVSSPMGICRGNTTSTAQNDSLWMSVKLNSSTQAEFSRNSDGGGQTSYLGIAIIDWGGMVVNVGSNPSPLDPDVTPVKSVETFRINIPVYWDYRDLTKGQVVENCAVFSSSRGVSTGSDQMRDSKAVVWLREPGVVIAHRTDGSGDALADISVVEFYPDQVKVQAGEWQHWGTTDEQPTISGVSDTSRAFILSSWEVNEATYWSRTSIRSRFVDNSTLQFYRNDSGNSVNGVFYVVEDLADNFRVRHVLANPTTYENQHPTDYFPYYSTMPIASYAVSNDNYYVDRSTARTGNTPSGGRVFVHRQNGTGTLYASFQSVRFLDNRRHLAPYAPSLDTSTSVLSATLLAEHQANIVLGAVSVYNPMQNDTGRGDTTGTDDMRGVFHTYRIVSGTDIEISRETPAGVTLAPSYGGIIDWLGIGHPEADEKFNPPINITSPTKSLVRSVEHFTGGGAGVNFYSLTKEQHPENCVPFASWRSDGDGGYAAYIQRMYYVDTVNNLIIASGESAGNPTGTMDESIYVVEFDPRQVRVQQLFYNFEGTSSTMTIPQEVDLTKTFMWIYYVSDDWSLNANSNLVRVRFDSSTQLGFYRHGSGNGMMVCIYLIECLQDQWYCQHENVETDQTGTDFADYINFGNWGSCQRFMQGSYTVTVTGNFYYTDRTCFRLYPRQDHGVQWQRNYNSGSLAARNTELLQFNPASNIRMGGYWTDLTAEGSETKPIASDYPLDLDRAMVCPSVAGCINRGTGTGNDDLGSITVKFELTDSSTITCTNYNNGITTYGWFQWVEWPPFKTHYFEGIVTEKNIPISRPVACFRADTNEMMDSTVSASGTGYYRLETTHSGSHYIVCQDDDPPIDYNHLVLGKMEPAPIISGTVWGDGYDGGII